MVFVFAVALAALVAFVLERFPIAQIALTIPVVLLVAGILEPAEALAGFAHGSTVTVAAMLALSLGLVKTGAMARLGAWARNLSLGGTTARLAVLCALVAVLSPFLNNTAVVVVFLPVFLAAARQADQPPSRFLMPLSFAAMLGGTITLIGTSTNLIVHGMAESRGFTELSMFSIAPLGLIYCAVGFVYLFTVGAWLLPKRAPETDISEKFDVRSFVTELQVPDADDIVGVTIEDLKWEHEYDVSVLGIRRHGVLLTSFLVHRRVEADDVLIVQGNSQSLVALSNVYGLQPPHVRRVGDADDGDLRLVEVLVGPDSPLKGKTLDRTRMRERFSVTVLAVQHHRHVVHTRLHKARLRAGDILLVEGEVSALEELAEEPGFIPLGEVSTPITDRPGVRVAVGTMVGVIGLASFGVTSILNAALVGVLVMLFTRCIDLQELFNELEWNVVFLLAGLIPLGTAMEITGAAEWLGEAASSMLEPLGPRAVIGGFYLLTFLLTAVMSNNATAIILTPVALDTAANLSINPYALLVAVMFGASASFLTPMGYQTNTLIYGPGGYRFVDYVRVGLPLNLLLLVLATLGIPFFFG